MGALSVLIIAVHICINVSMCTAGMWIKRIAMWVT